MVDRDLSAVKGAVKTNIFSGTKTNDILTAPTVWFFKLMQYCLALNKLKDILWVDFIYLKISYFNPIDRPQLGPRLLIKFLQDAAGKGELDPWDIDVISVIDSFLDQYSKILEKTSNKNNSYQKDLSETS